MPWRNIQLPPGREGRQNSRRKAAALIRSAGVRNHDKMMALFATSVELDAFTKVEGIDESAR